MNLRKNFCKYNFIVLLGQLYVLAKKRFKQEQSFPPLYKDSIMILVKEKKRQNV